MISNLLLLISLPGCPVKYLPISLHLPHLFKELQDRKLRSSHTKTWWHCNRIHSPVLVLGPSGAQLHQTTFLQEQIQAAILSPIPDTPDHENHFLKTSSSHPIKYVYSVPFLFKITHRMQHIPHHPTGTHSPHLFSSLLLSTTHGVQRILLVSSR